MRGATFMVGLGVIAAVGTASCRRTAPTPAAAGRAAPRVVVPPVALPADATDAVVATVDGRPIYASCVAAQARPGVDARAALDECIAFDLLAAAAQRAQVDADPDVQHALRRTLASAFVAREFEGAIHTAADLPAELVRPQVDAERGKYTFPEWREAMYVRAVVAPETGLDDATAEALVTAIRAALPSTHALLPAELFETARRVGATQLPADRIGEAAQRGTTPWALELETRPYRTPDDDTTELPYRRALFALAALGDVSPPVRTSRGWDLIIMTDRLPAETTSDADIAAALFPKMRQAYFSRWLAATLGDRYKVDVDVTPLEQVERVTSGSAPSGAPR